MLSGVQMHRVWIKGICLLLVGLLSACAADGGGCKTAADCDENSKCENKRCVPRCSCQPEEECTAQAPECKPEIVQTTDSSDVEQCLPCTFQSDCDDGNNCTKDNCEGGCCVSRVFSSAEAVGCCTFPADCQDPANPKSTPENSDGDPCTVDTCIDFHCKHEVLDPLCCHKDSDCTDENDCTSDTCMANQCVFTPTDLTCCARDKDCLDDNPCSMDICLSGGCVHPMDTLNLVCGCESNIDCDDANACTLDSCLDSKCQYDKAPGAECCGATAQCDDEDPTTDDFCKMYTCVHNKQKICVTDSSCDDKDNCTDDKCVEGICSHEHTSDPYCCNYDTDCDDGNVCTEGKCEGMNCKYQIRSNPGCCKSAKECDDGIGCTIDECKEWQCAHTPVGAKCCTPDSADVVCDDGNPCTIDLCQNGLCEWQMITTGCCEKDDDCLPCLNLVTGASCPVDHTENPPKCIGENCVINACTLFSCSNQFCYYTPVKDCCLTDKECKDSNPCTNDVCTAGNKCTNTLEKLCCGSNGMCNDGQICTNDICDIPAGLDKGKCKYSEKPDCCTSDAWCEPKTCKTPYCVNGNCVYVPQDDCCVHDEDCDDKDACTIDKCQGNSCLHIPSGICG